MIPHWLYIRHGELLEFLEITGIKGECVMHIYPYDAHSRHGNFVGLRVEYEHPYFDQLKLDMMAWALATAFKDESYLPKQLTDREKSLSRMWGDFKFMPYKDRRFLPSFRADDITWEDSIYDFAGVRYSEDAIDIFNEYQNEAREKRDKEKKTASFFENHVCLAEECIDAIQLLMSFIESKRDKHLLGLLNMTQKSAMDANEILQVERAIRKVANYTEATANVVDAYENLVDGINLYPDISGHDLRYLKRIIERIKKTIKQR